MLTSWLILPLQGNADSPLTSTGFAKAYHDHEIVKYAEKQGVVDQKIADYLLKKSNRIDVKAAVCNALSWNFHGKENATLLKGFIAKSFGCIDFQSVKERKIKDEVWMILGYLTALDNYFKPANALPYFEKVKRRKVLRSFTFQVLYALVKCQIAMESNWCMIWTIYDALENNARYKQDLRDEARDIIKSYLLLYKSSC